MFMTHALSSLSHQLMADSDCTTWVTAGPGQQNMYPNPTRPHEISMVKIQNYIYKATNNKKNPMKIPTLFAEVLSSDSGSVLQGMN